MQHNPTIPTHDVTLRLVVTRRMSGKPTPDKRHKAVLALRRLLSMREPYTVEVCEIVQVKPT